MNKPWQHIETEAIEKLRSLEYEAKIESLLGHRSARALAAELLVRLAELLDHGIANRTARTA